MKKLKMICALFLACAGLTACTKQEAAEESSGSLKIVAAAFPEYDWIRQLTAGTDTDVSLLMQNGTDLHSYQPSAEDIIRITSADVFVYSGGESQKWAEDALKEKNGGRAVSLLEMLGSRVKEEEIKEGMEQEEEEEEAAPDEHVWLSVKNASLLCEKITEVLAETDPADAEKYRTNLAAYQTKLRDLDRRYEECVSSAKRKVLLFADRFPFRYLTDDYGLDYYAAFAGCSAESEAGFDTIIFLARKADELALPYICQIEGSDGSIARTVIETSENKDRKILVFDSLQSVNAKDIAGGTDYLSVMEKNLSVLEEATHGEAGL